MPTLDECRGTGVRRPGESPEPGRAAAGGSIGAVPNPAPDLLPRTRIRLALALLGASVLLATVESHALWTVLRPWGQQHPILGAVWTACSDAARSVAVIGLVVAVAMIEPVAWRRQLVLTSALVPAAIGGLLKLAVARPRPIPDLHPTSWPSGHAITAFALAMALSAARHRPAIGVWLFCSGIALSRILVERHWPSDVLASLALCMLTVPALARLPVVVPAGPLPRVACAVGAVGSAAMLLALLLDPWRSVGPRSWALALGLVVLLHGISAGGAASPARPGPVR